MRILGVAALSAVVCGCASASQDIAPAYVSPVAYQNFTCQQLAMEAQAVSQRAATLSGIQDSQRTKDGWATAAAVVVFWPAAFFVQGDKQNAAELANIKGADACDRTDLECKKVRHSVPRAPTGRNVMQHMACSEIRTLRAGYLSSMPN